MMLHAANQRVATGEVAVERTVPASGIAQTSRCPTGVFTLLPVRRAGALTLLTTSA